MAELRLKRDVARRLTWSRPDSRIVPFCSLCLRHIPADAVPLRMWNREGFTVQFCDPCSEIAFEHAKT